MLSSQILFAFMETKWLSSECKWLSSECKWLSSECNASWSITIRVDRYSDRSAFITFKAWKKWSQLRLIEYSCLNCQIISLKLMVVCWNRIILPAEKTAEDTRVLNILEDFAFRILKQSQKDSFHYAGGTCKWGTLNIHIICKNSNIQGRIAVWRHITDFKWSQYSLCNN